MVLEFCSLADYFSFPQMYILSKGTMPMDVEFMVSDTFEVSSPDYCHCECALLKPLGSFQAIRPKMILHKTFLEAALAVDELVALNGMYFSCDVSRHFCSLPRTRSSD